MVLVKELIFDFWGIVKEGVRIVYRRDRTGVVAVRQQVQPTTQCRGTTGVQPSSGSPLSLPHRTAPHLT